MRGKKENYHTIQEVADTLKVAYLTVYRWIQDNRIQAYKMGKQYRISDNELSRFIKSSKYKNDKKG